MRIEVYKSISEIEKEIWSEAIKKRFFLSYNYLKSMEEGCQHISFRYAILRDAENRIHTIAYFQILPFKGENLFNYLPTNRPLLSKLIRASISWIDTRLLVLGNVIFTCENGIYFSENVAFSEKSIISIVHAVEKTIPERALGTMLSKSISSNKNSLFCHDGFHEFRVEDRMEIDITKFNDFDDYLSSLQSKYRVRKNKVYSLNNDVKIEEITKENFNEFEPQITSLFEEVLENSKFKLTKIESSYFLSFLKNIDRFKMDGYFIENKLVAFMTYYELENIIEVHYIGMNYKYNETNKVYNYMLYKILEKGIQTKSKKICYGRTAQELKSTLGAMPDSVYSSLKINNYFLNLLAPFLLKKLTPEPYQIRSPFKNN